MSRVPLRIEVTKAPLSPESLVNLVQTEASGCVVTYVGLIRRYSRDKRVISVEYEDSSGKATGELRTIGESAIQKWPLEGVGIAHRVSKLNVGDINLVVAIASAHREEGLAACRYVVDQFKERLPTRKTENYEDGSTFVA